MKGVGLMVAILLAAPPSITAADEASAVAAPGMAVSFKDLPATAVLAEPNASASVDAGDLDGDGFGDIVLAEQTQTAMPLGRVIDRLRVGVLSGGAATGAVRGGSTTASEGVAGLAQITMVRTGISTTPGGPPCFLVTRSGSVSSSGSLRCGPTGSVRWETGDLPSRRGATNGSLMLGMELMAPLDVADIDRDGVSEILVGRYTGVSQSDGLAVWTLEVAMIDAATGTTEKSYTAASIGVAPTARFAPIDERLGPLVSVATAAPTARGFVTQITNYYPQSPLAVPLPVSVWTTTLPRPAHPVALGLEALSGTAWSDGGVAVSLIADDRPARGLRGALIGPASSVGLGRGGLERFRVELPSPGTLELLDLNGDASVDLRTVRVDLDSLVVETWSGSGTNAKLVEHRMAFLEGDDYAKTVRVDPIGDVDADGIPDLAIAGGFPCGPRIEVVTRTQPLWQIPESRSYFCDIGLTAGGELDGALGDDLIEWQTSWTCCLSGPSPVAARFRARAGDDGVVAWTTVVPEWTRITSARGHTIGDVNGDGIQDPVVVVNRSPLSAARFDGATGEVAWTAEL